MTIYFIRMEDKVGSIDVGKYADLVILEKTLFDVKKEFYLKDLHLQTVSEIYVDRKSPFQYGIMFRQGNGKFDDMG